MWTLTELSLLARAWIAPIVGFCGIAILAGLTWASLARGIKVSRRDGDNADDAASLRHQYEVLVEHELAKRVDARRSKYRGMREDVELSEDELQAAIRPHAGRLVEQIPRAMILGRQEHIEIRLGRADAGALSKGLAGRGALVAHDIPIVETMAVRLYSKDSAFRIEPLSNYEQFTSNEGLLDSPLHRYITDFGIWQWNVTPLRRGAIKLFIRVSGRILSSETSDQAPVAHTLIPDKIIEIGVQTNVSTLAWKAALWILGVVLTAVGAIFSAAFRDLIEPYVLEIFRSIFAE